MGARVVYERIYIRQGSWVVIFYGLPVEDFPNGTEMKQTPPNKQTQEQVSMSHQHPNIITLQEDTELEVLPLNARMSVVIEGESAFFGNEAFS